MAKVLGTSGRFVSQEAIKLRRRIVTQVFLVVAGLGMMEGIFLSAYVPIWKLSPLLHGLLVFACLPALWWFGRMMEKRLDDLQHRQQNMESGLRGETRVAQILARLPDAFHVINDLTTPFGNLDHVVIGPTGVFILDAKNWRGLITPDGKGEILLNGRPANQPHLRLFVSRLMSVREKVRALAPGLDPYYQAAFVFTSARVEARWGTTGNVHCLSDDQLHAYIAEKDFGKPLPARQVQSLAQAFLALATMDREFPSAAPAPDVTLSKPPSPTRLPALTPCPVATGNR